MTLGRNQLIACVAFGVTFLSSIPVAALMNDASALQWLNWSALFVPVAVGTILGASAVIKATAIIKNGKQPE